MYYIVLFYKQALLLQSFNILNSINHQTYILKQSSLLLHITLRKNNAIYLGLNLCYFNFYKKAAMRLDSEAKRRHMELLLDSSCTNIGNKGDTPAAIQHVLSGSKLVKSVSSSESETSTEPESRLKNY